MMVYGNASCFAGLGCETQGGSRLVMLLKLPTNPTVLGPLLAQAESSAQLWRLVSRFGPGRNNRVCRAFINRGRDIMMTTIHDG